MTRSDISNPNNSAGTNRAIYLFFLANDSHYPIYLYTGIATTTYNRPIKKFTPKLSNSYSCPFLPKPQVDEL